MEPSYYISTDGGTSYAGPYAVSQIKSMWASGAITADTQAYDEAQGWRAVSEILTPIKSPKTSRHISGRRLVFFLLLLLAGATALVMTSIPIEELEKGEAGARAEQYVRACLRAPSTAKFTGTSAYLSSGGKYSARGYVDCQNGFGAMLRSEWRCMLWKDGGKWEPLEITIDGKSVPIER